MHLPRFHLVILSVLILAPPLLLASPLAQLIQQVIKKQYEEQFTRSDLAKESLESFRNVAKEVKKTPAVYEDYINLLPQNVAERIYREAQVQESFKALRLAARRYGSISIPLKVNFLFRLNEAIGKNPERYKLSLARRAFLETDRIFNDIFWADPKRFTMVYAIAHHASMLNIPQTATFRNDLELGILRYDLIPEAALEATIPLVDEDPNEFIKYRSMLSSTLFHQSTEKETADERNDRIARFSRVIGEFGLAYHRLSRERLPPEGFQPVPKPFLNEWFRVAQANGVNGMSLNKVLFEKRFLENVGIQLRTIEQQQQQQLGARHPYQAFRASQGYPGPSSDWRNVQDHARPAFPGSAAGLPYASYSEHTPLAGPSSAAHQQPEGSHPQQPEGSWDPSGQSATHLWGEGMSLWPKDG
ncbi:hypothetical protein ACQY0O_005624 [Thecaphora frezii]